MPIFRVVGMEHTDPAAQAILRQNEPAIRRFYHKAAAASAAGMIPLDGLTTDLGNVKLRYQQLNGQELVTVIVSPSKASERSAKKSGNDPWLWALINLEIPNIATSDVRNAVIKAYRRVLPPTEPGLAYEGWAYDRGISHDTSDGKPQPTLSFAPRGDGWLPEHAPIEEIVVEPAGGTQVASLRVDMRDRVGAPVVIELWGYLLGYVDGYRRIAGSYALTSTSFTTSFPGGSGSTYTPTIESFWEYANQEVLLEWPGLGNPLGAVFPTDPFSGTAHPGGIIAAFHGVTYAPGYSITAPKPTEISNPSMDPYLPFMVNASSSYTATYHSSGLVSSFTQRRLVPAPPLPDGAGGFTQQFFIETTVYTFGIEPARELGWPNKPISRDVTIRGIGGFEWPAWTVERHDFPEFTFSPDLPDRGAAQWVSDQSNRLAEIGHADIRADAATAGAFDLLGVVTIDPIEHIIQFSHT